VTDSYQRLLQTGRPVLTTAEAAGAWGVEARTAGHRLRVLGEAGIVKRLRRGLWALDPEIERFAIGPYLTAPFPSYVSLWSALARHGMIDQIPRQVSLVSLDRARRIETELGGFEVHHISPELFTGFEGTPESGYLAQPEKALFDLVYLRAAAGRRAYLTELNLPADFEPGLLSGWQERIAGGRLRTIVATRLGEVLAAADPAPAVLA
jgi:predicted transcriptional regulator of viral defense system